MMNVFIYYICKPTKIYFFLFDSSKNIILILQGEILKVCIVDFRSDGDPFSNSHYFTILYKKNAF